MSNGVSRKTFDRMSVDSKLGVLFDLIHDNYKDIQDVKKELAQIKKGRLYHKAYASAGGVIGGILAAIGIKWLGN